MAVLATGTEQAENLSGTPVVGSCGVFSVNSYHQISLVVLTSDTAFVSLHLIRIFKVLLNRVYMLLEVTVQFNKNVITTY